jgi:hypothetical protein
MSKKPPWVPRDPRMERLRGLEGGKQAADVCTALKRVWDEGLRPPRVLVRRQYARLDIPVSGPVSDRKLPARPSRPPSTRLIYPRGVAQDFYLTMLFVTQCERGPGQRVASGRPLSIPSPTATGLRPWTDLVMVPAERRAGTSTHHSVEINRLRQLEAAVRKLAADDVRLVDLPHSGDPRGRLKGFVPLVESGLLGYASRTPYSVPGASDEVFSVPASFFMNGWHSALTASEVAMLFAVWAASPNDAASASHMWLEGEARIRRYGLSPAAYGTQAFLQDLDVLHVDVPDGRREDGTFVGLKKGESPLLNSFMVLETGFDKPAVPVVMATLKSR